MKFKTVSIFISVILVFVLTLTLCVAANDIEEFSSCNLCGMDRKMYGYSRMLITFENGTRVGTCSLHCAVIEMDTVKTSVRLVQVADRNSHELIEAEKATWVTGGRKRGVMTQNPKWAFATRASAEAFIGSYGGNVTDWSKTRAAAQNDK